MRSKLMIHDKCGGVVSHKTRVCNKCTKTPSGNEVTLIRKGEK